MKTVSYVTAFLVAGLVKPCLAQNCQSSYFATPNSMIETTEYAADKTLKSTKVYTVKSVVNKNSQGITSKYQSIKTEANGKVSEDKVMTYQCNQGDVTFELGAEDAKTKKEAIVTYPAAMKAGMALKPDVSFEQSGKTPDGKSARITIKISDRKVVGNESITVPAGTWNCTKITYSFLMKLKVGIISLPINAQVTEWYHPQVGVVRNETWIKQKLEAYSEITALKK